MSSADQVNWKVQCLLSTVYDSICHPVADVNSFSHARAVYLTHSSLYVYKTRIVQIQDKAIMEVLAADKVLYCYIRLSRILNGENHLAHIMVSLPDNVDEQSC